jgi:AraC-like DNA-binding protein
MFLDYFPPSPAYRKLLTMHALVQGVGQPIAALVPAMLPNLHIRLRGQSTYILANGRRVVAPAVSLVGPTNGAYRFELSPDALIVGTGFLPLGWLRLVRCPAAALADDVVDGADIWGPRACERAWAQLQEAPRDGGHVRILESLLAEPERRAQHLDYLRAADRWLESAPTLAVEDLRADLDIGRRQLQRVILDLYGAAPKVLAMKYRALRAAARLAGGDRVSIPDLLTPYADQPHLTRNFRRFLGVTPGAFLKDGAAAAAATMIGRRRAGAARPLVLWS